MKITSLPDAESLGQAAALRGAREIRNAILTKGSAKIILATGASQFAVLKNLVQAPDVDWKRVTLFHLDEYLGIDAEHPASFRKYLHERFVRLLPAALHAAHWIQGDASEPLRECERLNEIIKQHPIDVAFIGIGENAHLAFNDPPADFLTDSPFIVVSLDEACRQQQLGEGWFPSLESVPRQAISMSIKQILKSKTIICSVPDERKAEAVRKTITGPVKPEVPASILQTHEQTWLYLDYASASLLPADGVPLT